MYIRTTGKPTKILLKTCKDAVKFYGKFLLSDILYHKINLKIIQTYQQYQNYLLINYYQITFVIIKSFQQKNLMIKEIVFLKYL